MVIPREESMALLETALFVFLLLSLITASLGIWDYLELKNSIRSAVEKNLNNSSVKPFSFSLEADSPDFIELNEARIRDSLRDAVEKAHEDLVAKVSYFRKNTSSLFMQGCYGVIEIERSNGHFKGIDHLECPAEMGNFSLLKEKLPQNNLVSKMLEKAKRQIGPQEGPCLSAVPDGTQNSTFFSRGVVLGLRAGSSLKDSTAFLLPLLFQDSSLVYHDQIITLRGDIS